MMNLTKRLFFKSICAGMCTPLLSLKAFAQEVYKHRFPVRLIVPYPPGGAGDSIARLFANPLGDALKQPIIIENKGGGAQIIATEAAAKAKPDGYTLFFASTTHGINPGFKRPLPYDTMKDFAPITLVGSTPLMWVAHPSLKVKTIQELVARAGSSPIYYGSAGPGSGGHLAVELFKFMAGIDLIHTPYKGTGPALNDLLSGQIQLLCTSPIPVLPFVKSGKLQALAMTSAKRSSIAPDLPTVAESGYPDYQASLWYALLVQAKVPLGMQQVILDAATKALQQPETIKTFKEQGIDILNLSPSATEQFIRAEIDRWTKTISYAKIQVD
jgi:tripartite-type tricarboxylate transporter receptor subunit TctC